MDTKHTPALADFAALDPQTAMSALEEAYGISCDGTFNAYPSYINRVYGVRDDEGTEFVAKFYRPGRWTTKAIEEEHAFLLELKDAEVPVVPPLPSIDGGTLSELLIANAFEGTAGEHAGETLYPFALFKKRSGRSFDADGLEDMKRLGALAGRIHAVGSRKKSVSRAAIRSGMARSYAAELLSSGAIHPDAQSSFALAVGKAADFIDGALASHSGGNIRLHGDFHRGNILDRLGEGLVAIDFDDMCTGPALADLWLLLPSLPADCPKERDTLIEGYENFMPFDATSLSLAPVLQLLRIIHYLAWQARQRLDTGFSGHFPSWGSRGFWLSEAEDLLHRVDKAAGNFLTL